MLLFKKLLLLFFSSKNVAKLRGNRALHDVSY